LHGTRHDHGWLREKKSGDYIKHEAYCDNYYRENQDLLIIDIYLMLFPLREF
jgi:hypothetical protein